MLLRCAKIAAFSYFFKGKIVLSCFVIRFSDKLLKARIPGFMIFR